MLVRMQKCCCDDDDYWQCSLTEWVKVNMTVTATVTGRGEDSSDNQNHKDRAAVRQCWWHEQMWWLQAINFSKTTTTFVWDPLNRLLHQSKMKKRKEKNGLVVIWRFVRHAVPLLSMSPLLSPIFATILLPLFVIDIDFSAIFPGCSPRIF